MSLKQFTAGDIPKLITRPLTDENSGAPSKSGWFFLTGDHRTCIARDNVAFTVDENSIGQFTGLHDKNGKEVYEGDAVNSEKLNARAEVRYGNAHFFVTGGTAARPLIAAGYDLSPEASEIEVIGNIHEDPELLNGPRS